MARKSKGPCEIEGCTKPGYIGLLCTTHYKRKWRHGDANVTYTERYVAGQTCREADCFSPPAKRGWCVKHHARWQRHGTPDLVRSENYAVTLTNDGYEVQTVEGARQLIHRMLAEKALGRSLPPKAVIHHVTENRTDNYGPFKLVICPDQAYHLLIHRLMKQKGISFKTGWPNHD